ncbi:MAG: hypothetical protein AAF718_08700 [Pseudomonadota bacterium]
MFEDLSPLARSRVAFAALIVSLYLIAGDRTAATGDPGLLYLIAPSLAVFGVGHAATREAMMRAAISVAAIVGASLVASLAHGRGMPNYSNLSTFVTAVTGVFALNLVLLVLTSKIVERFWPKSDHWTR